MGNVGIPTKHNGRQFRSRLEARWATFFDMLGWKYEYEPFDLDGWIPDFLLIGREPVLVEIKPVVEFPSDVAAKIAKARPEHEVLLLGCVLEPPCLDQGDLIRFGWLCPKPGDDSAQCWDVATFGAWPGGTIGFSAVDGNWFNRVGPGSGKYYQYRFSEINPCVRFWWTEAGNRVQWKAPH